MASLDAIKLAERLQGLTKEEYWLHLEAASPLEKYPAKHHARRVRDKLDVKEGLIYLPGSPARANEDSDMPAPFRQRRYFYYLSGCNEPNCHVVYDLLHDTLALFIPRINPERVIWNGRGSTPAEALDKYDIDMIFFADELEAWIQAWVMRNRATMYILHESQAPKLPYFLGQPNSTVLQPAMNIARMVKDEHEVKLIRKANDISSEAHKQVLANILRFKNEAQVEGLFLNVCISKQAKQQAYDPIAASGPNAGTLHYDANNEDFDDRQLMCLDAGCEFELYASDITRTFPLSGSWPSLESEKIYKLVQRMQEACIERLAPGVRYLDLHILAHQIAIDGLLQLGILHNGTREEIYKAGTSKAFFPHGLGHHVGLEVHDVGQRELMSFYEKNPKYEKAPSLYPEDFHMPVYDVELCRAPTDPQSPHLEEGMVVTVEPGIYFSAYALSYFYLPSPVHSKYINTEVVYRYFPVGGVRIEDDILITSKGHENLTTAPKGEAMLDIIRSQNAKWPFVSATMTPAPTTQKTTVIEKPARRAPGISHKVSEPRLRPIARAATMPVKGSRDRGSPDFEPCSGPSLFSGFKRSVTTQEAVPGPNTSSVRPVSTVTQQNETPMCGHASKEHVHIWVTSAFQQGNASSVSAKYGEKPKPICGDCVVLSQTMERLRETLKRSPKVSPKLEQTTTVWVEPTTMKPLPEMEQICPPTKPVKPSQDAPCSLPPFSELPDPFAGPSKLHRTHNRAQAPQIRSATFDSFETARATAAMPKLNASNPWSTFHTPSLRNARAMTNPDPLQDSTPPPQPQPAARRGLHAAFDPERALRHLLTEAPTSLQDSTPPPQPQAAARRGLHAASDPEKALRDFLTGAPTSRPSIPTLRSGRTDTAPSATTSSSRHSAAPALIPGLCKDPNPRPVRETRPVTKTEASNRDGHRRSLGPLNRAPRRNPWSGSTTTVQSGPSQAPERSLQDQKLDDLRRAMDELWRVKEDVERTFGTSWREERKGEGKRERRDRVVSDVDNALNENVGRRSNQET